MLERCRSRVLLAFLGLCSALARAQDAATIADVRCVIIGMQLSGVPNSSQQYRSIVLTWYYIGRLEGRTPKLDIKSLVIEETNKMNSSDYESETRRCEAGMKEKGQQIMQIGQDLMERQKSK
jgi:hypothetical protein